MHLTLVDGHHDFATTGVTKDDPELGAKNIVEERGQIAGRSRFRGAAHHRFDPEGVRECFQRAIPTRYADIGVFIRASNINELLRIIAQRPSVLEDRGERLSRKRRANDRSIPWRHAFDIASHDIAGGPRHDRNPDLPNTPFALDFVRNEEDKQLMQAFFAQDAAARPMIAPPGIPVDRHDALRIAFMSVEKDSEFLSDAETSLLTLGLGGHLYMKKIVDIVADTPPALAQRFNAITAP